jgi:hypothetical protein
MQTRHVAEVPGVFSLPTPMPLMLPALPYISPFSSH